ncbi:hypothetical protein [Marinilabilia salmonicolor]|uniref:Uncharacterized protein n=1 Tax=Marinilabilia salmonicolor TaxID=989 RepID=A0A368VBP0_9BACT|nr:hypothetical protein [Marinilabilia salmonicolor]RCW38677.1 hypothetical protein DFO77_103147 [Marinilabilia salmonicolor]
MNEKVIKVEVEVLNNTLEYLSTQPFKEVAQLITGIQKSVQENNQPEQEEKREEEKKKK